MDYSIALWSLEGGRWERVVRFGHLGGISGIL